MVEAAESDVVGPTVASHDPDGFEDEKIGEPAELAGLGGVPAMDRGAEFFHAGALGGDVGFGGLRGAEDFLDEAVADAGGKLAKQHSGVVGVFVHSDAQAEAVFGVVLEEGV